MSWFLNLRISAKLLTAFSLVLAITLAVGGFALYTLNGVNGRTTDITSNWMPSVEASSAMNTVIANVRVAQFRHVLATSDSDMDAAEGDIAARGARLDSLVTRYLPLITSPQEKERFETFKAAWATYMRTWEQVQADSRANRQAEARDRMGSEGRRQFEEASAALNDIVVLNTSGALAAGSEASASYARSRVIFAVVLACAMVLGLSLAVGIARVISRPLGALAENAEAIARGQLDMQLTAATRDELGTLQGAFGRMVEAQRAMTRGAVAIAAGDMSVSVTSRGDRDELGQAFVALRSTLQGMLTETNTLVTAAKNGQLNTRGNATQFTGPYRDLVQGINDTLDAVVAPINDASLVLAALADRDLTARVTSQYAGDHTRMREAINLAAETLEEAMRQVSGAANQTAAAGEQIAAGSQSLARGASEQAASLEEIASSLQELSATAIATAGNATEARAMTETARKAVGAGATAMQQLSDAMDRIKSSSDQTARIVKTIDEIAFQTNLLALNAAVEAARAGDAGRGFAVVADEVRTLAIRCAEAARNTTALIEEGVQVTASGVSLNADVTARLTEIDREVTRVSSVVADIATAGTAQRDGVQQITQAVNELNDVTQQVAANAEESASASEELAGQSQSLKSLVAQFQLAGEAEGRRAPITSVRGAPMSRQPAKARTQRTAKPVVKSAMPFTGKPTAPRSAPVPALDPMDEWPDMDAENDSALLQF